MAIELMTGLHPTAARELVEDSTSEELASIIGRYHDGDKVVHQQMAEAAAARGAGKGQRPSVRCRWPAEALEALTAITVRTVHLLPAKHRATLQEVLPELELLPRLGAGTGAGGGWRG